MRDTKYYTPSIEEFHVGFEYEEFHREPLMEEGFWSNCKIEEDFATPPIIYGIFCCHIRVKYLDQDDILELGWSIDKEESEFFKDTIYKMGNQWMWEDDDGDLIISQSAYVPNEAIFIGTIKNKSELKVLMKQLGVT